MDFFYEEVDPIFGIIPELMMRGRRWNEVQGVVIDEGFELGIVCCSRSGHVVIEVAGDNNRAEVVEVYGEV